jgi:ribosomal protein S18 acetylase RimI-like enzyme
LITIRPFQDDDAEKLSVLMAEMTEFYGAAVAVGLDIMGSIISNSKLVDILLAEQEEKLLGFATFGTMYPVAGLVPFTYIQQIYVREGGRRMGVARSLMQKIAKTSIERGMTRVEWSTSHENFAAQALYRRLGADGEDKVHFVLKGAALRALVDAAK